MASRSTSPLPLYRTRWSPQPAELYDEPSTCLSAEPHHQAVHDPVQHYFGCLEIYQRPRFLVESNIFWKYQRNIERKKLTLAMIDQQNRPPTEEMETKLNGIMEKKMVDVAFAIEWQYRQIELLRKAVMQSLSSGGQPSLVDNAEKSRHTWMNSYQFRDGIEMVRTWRKRQQGGYRPTDPVHPGEHTVSHRIETGREEIQRFLLNHHIDSTALFKGRKYSAEQDVHANIIQFTVPEVSDNESLSLEKQFLKAADVEPADVRIKGIFPDQRMSVSQLLNNGEDLRQNVLNPKDDWNIINKDKNMDAGRPLRIRYFHIPSNNMTWVEKALANYYADILPNVKDFPHIPASQTSTEMLLKPQYWEGQHHGTRSGISYERHTHSLCEMVSTGTRGTEKSSKNIVLFMPYLHWETHRVHRMTSQIIDDRANRQRHIERARKEQRKQQRVDSRDELPRPGKKPKTNLEVPNKLSQSREIPVLARASQLREVKSITWAVERWMFSRRLNKFRSVSIDSVGRLKVRSDLGQYLIDSARLYEAMFMFKDKQIIERYLCHNFAFHPRRSLRQYINRGFNSTSASDKEQIVYQETSSDSQSSYRFVSFPNDLNSLDDGDVAGTDTGEEVPLKPPSTIRPCAEHYAYTDLYGCEICRQNIIKVPKLLTVDQLWMWVLDEHTIITSFPQNWERSTKHDIPEIHESIRTRLRSMGSTHTDDQIRSVYELGLLILGECSTVLLEKTNVNSRLKVLDTFSEVIGRIGHRHSGLLDDLRSRIRRIPNDHPKLSDLSSLRLRLLDNTEEEKLQQELRQVLIDLDVMLDVQKQQDTFIRRFCQHAEKNLSGNQNEDMRLRFRGQSQNLLQKLSGQLSELERLQKWTESTALVINDLVNIKQQHASLIKAQESMRQADESTSQGRAVMMFTVVTVIFVPLSFISSIFGMNNIEFSGETPMSLKQQFGIMFPISLSIIAATIIVAFSKSVRGVMWSTCKASAALPLLLASTVDYLFTVAAVRLGLLSFWVPSHNKERFQVNMLRNRIESAARQMRRVAETEAKRKIRVKEFERRTGHKLDDTDMDEDERRSVIDFIFRRHPSLIEEGLSPNTAGNASSSSGTEQLHNSYRSSRWSLFQPKETPATSGGHAAADGSGDPAGAFALEMGPVDAGRRIIDRRARGERVHAVIEEEERSRASQDGVQDGVH